MRRVALLLCFLLSASLAQAASTINPNTPAQSSDLTSSVVRNNFLAAYTDVNNILGVFAGVNPPVSPTNLQSWADTSASPNYVFRYWNQQTTAWVPYGTLNVNTGVWTPYGSSSGYAATAPLTVGVSGGVVTYGLNTDSNFAVVGGALALAPITSGNLIANCGASSAEPVACSWTTFADRAISASNNSLPYRSGGSWGTIATGVAGHVLPLLDGTNTWTATQTVYPGSSSIQPALPGTLFRAVNLDGVSSRMEATSYGVSSIFSGVRVNGTAASPLTLVADNPIMVLDSWGYNGTALSGGAGAIRIWSGGTWSVTNRPTYVDFATTANGDATMTLTSRMRVENNGGITVGGASNQGTGTLNITGLIYNNGTAPVGSGGYVLATSNATTVNGQVCALGGVCTISASAGAITVGTTVVNGSPGILFNSTSGGVLSSVGVTNNAVLVTNGSGTYSFATTMPSALTIPSPALTTPNIVGGIASAITAFGLRDTSAAFDVTLAATSSPTLTVARTITFNVNDGNRAINLGGGITIAAGGFATAGGFSTILTTTAATNVTLPNSGTLATLAGTEALTNKTINGITISPSSGSITVNTNSLGLSGSGSVLNFVPPNSTSTNVTLPGTSSTMARTDAGQTFTGSQIFTGTVGMQNAATVATANALAFSVGLNGVTNPAFQVDTSTALQAAGIKVTGAVTGGTAFISAIDSGANTNLGMDAKGAGQISIGFNSSGAINLGNTSTVVNIGQSGAITLNVGKASAASGTLTIAGSSSGAVGLVSQATASGTLTLPNGTDTLVARNSTDTLQSKTILGFTLGGTMQTSSLVIGGGATVTVPAALTTSFTADCNRGPLQPVTGPTSAWSITAPAADGSCMFQLTNAASSAVAPSFSGFSVGSSTGAPITTVGSSKFVISIWRIGGTSGYSIFANQ